MDARSSIIHTSPEERTTQMSITDKWISKIWHVLCLVMSDSVTPGTVARQAPLSMGILQVRILEWVAMPSSKGSSQPRNKTPGLPHCRQILYCLSHQGSPRILKWVAYPSSRGNFPTQKSNPGFLHCRRILYQLSHPGSPRILEWVAYPFSSGSS